MARLLLSVAMIGTMKAAMASSASSLGYVHSNVPLRAVGHLSVVGQGQMTPLKLGAPLPLHKSSRTAFSVFGLRSMAEWGGGVKPMRSNFPLRSDMQKVSVKTVDTAPKDYKGEMLVFGVMEPEGEDKEALSTLCAIGESLDGVLDGTLADLIKSSEFKGKAGTTASVTLSKSFPIRKVSLVGIGKKDKFDAGVAGKLGGVVATLAKGDKTLKTMAVVLPDGCASASARSMLDAMHTNLYKDSRYKTGDGKEKPLAFETLQLLNCKMDISSEAEQSVKVNEGVSLCRDLVAAPANYVTPTVLAQVAKEIAEETGMECEILEREDCEKMGMGSFLGVSQGACEPPKFIHLTYKASGPVKKKIAVVGKGLTFDSGGYNIKAGPGSMIEMMKFDMGGSGATLGAAKAVGLLKPEGVEAHFIVASCENMVSAEAMRPGDILTAMNGKTIEVGNTDAEGRLTLADAIVFAEKQGCESIIDIATLTGACLAALGEDYAGLWSNNETLASTIKECAKDTNEKLWQMPMVEEYAEQLKSKIADLKNIGGPRGGAITAALFLKEFVSKASWAHLDIAGPVWSDKGGGATGYGVKLLTQWVAKEGK